MKTTKVIALSALALSTVVVFHQRISADAVNVDYHTANQSFLDRNQTDFNQVLQVGKNKILPIKSVFANPQSYGLETKYGFVGGVGQPWNSIIGFNEYYQDSAGNNWVYNGYDVNQDHSVYRLYNPNTGEHFYTVSSYETFQLNQKGWNFEGIGWQSPTDQAKTYSNDSSTASAVKISPVYRLYNPNVVGGDHYYTTSSYEAGELVNKGWKWDYDGKPVFYTGGDSPIYVAYNPNATSGSHNYTISMVEQNNLLSLGWKYGATAMYGG